MTTIKTKTIQPKLYSFIISPQLVQLKNDKGEFSLDPKIIPQSVCNVVAYDLDGAFKYISGIVQGKGVQAKHTNDEPLSNILKMTDQFVEPVAPVLITSPPVVDPVDIRVNPEHWTAYLRDESKKIGYKLTKIYNREKL